MILDIWCHQPGTGNSRDGRARDLPPERIASNNATVTSTDTTIDGLKPVFEAVLDYWLDTVLVVMELVLLAIVVVPMAPVVVVVPLPPGSTKLSTAE